MSPNPSIDFNSLFPPLRYHPVQYDLWNSSNRFNVVHAGRRSGKTELRGKRKMVQKAIIGSQFIDWKGFAAAPTRDQAKRIYWSDLKKMVPDVLQARTPSESQLIIFVRNSYGGVSEIHVLGMDKPARVEGTPWDHGLLDEYGNMKMETWPAHVRPALSDRRGTCDFIGVPEGRNHYYELSEKARLDQSGVWGNYHWLSADVLPAEEIEQAKEDLDLLTYQQEYEGAFVLFVGLAYYNFDSKIHISRCRQYYNPEEPLIITLDFNVSPGTASVLQEMRQWPEGQTPIIGQTISSVIGEVHIPRNSNTDRVCRKLIEDWSKHRGMVYVYGDATGGASGSAKVKGSDWDLVRGNLQPVFGDRFKVLIKRTNPRERARINAVNSRLLNMKGDAHFQVDGKHADHVVKDFEGVRTIEGSAGEIDKKKTPHLTHLSDGIGYYISYEFPIIKATPATGY